MCFTSANFRVDRYIRCRDLRGGGAKPPPPPMESSPPNNPMGLGLSKISSLRLDACLDIFKAKVQEIILTYNFSNSMVFKLIYKITCILLSESNVEIYDHSSKE